MIQPLKSLAQQVRSSTLDRLERVPEDWLTWAPAGTSNHILWHAGHALWVQEVLTLKPLTGSETLPTGWADTFGQYCRPIRLTTEWPSRPQLVDLLKGQLDRVLDVFDEHAEELITSPNRQPNGGGWPLLDGIIHGWHDEARHHGEIYLLYKLQQANRISR